MKYAFVRDGVAVEVVQSNPAMLFNAGYAAQFVEVPDDVMQGWLLVDGQWSAPVEPEPEIIVPQEVTMRQARLALHEAGKYTLIQPAIDALPDPPRTRAQIEWDFSNTVRRDGEITQLLGQSIGLTSEEIDALFIDAATR